MLEITRATLTLLRETIENDPRSRLLDEKEALLSGSKEVEILSKNAKEKAEEYAKATRFEDEEGKARATKAFHEAKKALDEHPLTRDYQAAYSEVRRLLTEIESILFAPYRDRIRCGGHHD